MTDKAKPDSDQIPTTHLPPENLARRRIIGYTVGTVAAANAVGLVDLLHQLARDSDKEALQLRQEAAAPPIGPDTGPHNYLSTEKKREFATLFSEGASEKRWMSVGAVALGATASAAYLKLIAPGDPEPMAEQSSSGKISRRGLLIRGGQLAAGVVTAKAVVDVVPKLPEIAQGMNKVGNLREEAKAAEPDGHATPRSDALNITADKVQIAIDDKSISALRDTETAGAGIAAVVGLHKLNNYLQTRKVAQDGAKNAVERAMARAKGDTLPPR